MKMHKKELIFTLDQQPGQRNMGLVKGDQGQEQVGCQIEILQRAFLHRLFTNDCMTLIS